MPSAQTIIHQLTLASNRAASVAVGWHVAIAVAVLAVVLGWRPSKRTAGVMLAAPIVSAAAVALALGNPFNGSILGALAVALVLLALRLGSGRVARGSAAAATGGMLLILFGAFYPHFVESRTPLAYLFVAPTGLIPCPTLSLVIGVALLAGGLGSRAWSVVLAAAGLFYGLFGVARLRVYLDIPLILGAAALLAVAIARIGREGGQSGPTRERRRPRHRWRPPVSEIAVTSDGASSISEPTGMARQEARERQEITRCMEYSIVFSTSPRGTTRGSRPTSGTDRERRSRQR